MGATHQPLRIRRPPGAADLLPDLLPPGWVSLSPTTYLYVSSTDFSGSRLQAPGRLQAVCKPSHVVLSVGNIKRYYRRQKNAIESRVERQKIF